MRIRNFYGMTGNGPIHRPLSRPEPGPRRPITSRGREVLEASRRRTSAIR